MEEEYDGFSFGHDPEKPFMLHQIYEGPGSTKQKKCCKCGRLTLPSAADTQDIQIFGLDSNFLDVDQTITFIRCPDCSHEANIHNG